ncbi:MAG TPA: HD domain-containing phosphohydrolase [Gemmatales bacterium]|nr:HD domain-containing phosphohydrolase [Gemmatales bacterium]HMP59781.1 HD domain-containing phosphohydrolase [Gemmatales bacterium]
MAATPGLLERLTALRQRLGEMTLPSPTPATGQQLRDLEQQLAALRQANRQVEEQIGQLLGTAEASSDAAPPVLTWRLRRLVLRARQTVEQLKGLMGPFARTAETGVPLELLQATIAMAQFVLGALETLPADERTQDRLADGLEANLAAIERRHAQLQAVAERQKRRRDHIRELAHLLERLGQETPPTPADFQPLIDAVLEEHGAEQPLVWAPTRDARLARWAAGQGWNTAAALARVVGGARGDWPQWREMLLAGLIHDVGLTQLDNVDRTQGEFDLQARRELERHPTAGAELLARVWPGESWLAEAVAAHHENLDGTGYPKGRQGHAIPTLARWLRLAESYAALSQSTPQRPALSPRAALTEVLLEGERGRLDLALGEKLHQALTPTPTGTLVELSDGSLGLVRRAGPRPFLQIVAADDGRTPPLPLFVDLARWPQRQMVRVFPLEEARQLLGPDHLELW